MWKLIAAIVLTPFIVYVAYSYYVLNSTQAAQEAEAKEIVNERIEKGIEDQKNIVVDSGKDSFSSRVDDSIDADMKKMKMSDEFVIDAANDVSAKVLSDKHLANLDNDIVDKRTKDIKDEFADEEASFNSSVDNFEMGE